MLVCQVALLVALVERLWSWLTGESRDGGPGPVEERGAGGGLTLVLQDVVNTQLTVHNKKVRAVILQLTGTEHIAAARTMP